MTDVPSPRLTLLNRIWPRTSPAAPPRDRYAEAALERHKREGLEMAVRARWIALAVVALMLPVLNFAWEMLWYEALLAALAAMGWLQRRVGRVGLSYLELGVLFADLALLTVALVLPNPFQNDPWPAALAYHFGNFNYFFIILAAGTLAYSWRTITAIGTWTAVLWALGAVWVHVRGLHIPALSAATEAAFGADPRMVDLLDPNRVQADIRLQEIVVFVIVANVLAFSIRRLQRLVLSNAALERERSNLSRYFSPRVVEELSHKDEPLKETREHEVAVLFVDIEGFTAFAAGRPPSEVIGVLRRFHEIVEGRIFAHGGTLDKFLGDGAMATFGTPEPGDRDVVNALEALRAMIGAMAGWNAERAKAGEAPVRARFGLHFGPVVLGDIGATQLEFAVIGHTVNVASRLEALTRDLGVTAILSEDMRRAAVSADVDGLLDGFEPRGAQRIRGIDGEVSVWALA